MKSLVKKLTAAALVCVFCLCTVTAYAEEAYSTEDYAEQAVVADVYLEGGDAADSVAGEVYAEEAAVEEVYAEEPFAGEAYVEETFADEAYIEETFSEEIYVDGTYEEEVYSASGTGWQFDGNGWWYVYSDGTYPVASWASIEDHMYHFNENGYMDTGWLWDGAWYYLYPDGTMATGWATDGYAWYYMGTSGAMQTGWTYVDDSWYYLDGSGMMKTGWLWDGAWYYMLPDGTMAVGWVFDGSGWYYMDIFGVLTNGWLLADDNWYYMDKSSGRMKVGWAQIDSVWYFFNELGQMQTGWQQISGDWYYFTESGAMVTGHYTIDGIDYYFLDNGMLYSELDANQVIQIQTALINLGYMNGYPDGVYNDRTVAAIKTFQITHGYGTINGLITESLYNLILAETVPFTPIGAYSTGMEVYGLQQALQAHDMVMIADGVFGSLTQYAILQIQKMFGLPQTGTADAETMYYIFYYDDHVGNYYDVQGYSSSSNYLIFINATTNRMYIYTGSANNWSLLYNWECATGTAETPTVLGQFNTYNRGYYFGDDTYTCYYFTAFHGAYYIHSTIYDGYTWNHQDSRLGMNLSHGCVRLQVDNAKWIYSNVPLGTKVVVVQ